jgi:hypothetical protein
MEAHYPMTPEELLFSGTVISKKSKTSSFQLPSLCAEVSGELGDVKALTLAIFGPFLE